MDEISDSGTILREPRFCQPLVLACVRAFLDRDWLPLTNNHNRQNHDSRIFLGDFKAPFLENEYVFKLAGGRSLPIPPLLCLPSSAPSFRGGMHKISSEQHCSLGTRGSFSQKQGPTFIIFYTESCASPMIIEAVSFRKRLIL